jgi:hypothetical protein
MILYLNGDSHTVGHGIRSPHGLTIDDDRYLNIDEAPHPENLPFSYGARLADKLNCDMVCQARSGGSVARAIRTTKQFVYQTQGEIFVVIGLPSFEREEWFHNGAWWPVNSGGHDALPPTLATRYKQWVMDFNNTTYSYLKRQEVILGLVGQFHSWLQEHNVKHLFFNTAQSFHPNCQNKVDFGDNFVEPYGDWKNNFQFVEWTKNKGCVPDRWGHYGEDGHAAWAEFLLPYVERILTK